MYQFENL